LRITDRTVLGRRLQGLRIRLAMLERAEGRHADERVKPHIKAAERDACPGSKLGPEWLHVADTLQILADLRTAPSIFIGRKFIMRPTFRNGFSHLVGSK